MASVLATYNREIMATECPRCGVVNARCKGQNNISNPQPSHSVRRRAAGFVWSKTTQQLEPLV
jgi:hypothetical protein